MDRVVRRRSRADRRQYTATTTLAVVVLALTLSGATAAPAGQVGPATAVEPRVVLLTWHGVIGPVSSEYLGDGLEAAEAQGAELLVLALDTPGGLDTAMRDMVRAILASPVPVAVYVWPEGARAASAGVFLLAAANVAAMAPSTNAGAAHPVNMGGKMDEVMSGKVTNDAVAYLTGLAAGRGRSTDWCEGVVRESVSVPADSALALGLADVVAVDLEALLAWCDGRTPPGCARALATDGAWVVEQPLSWRQRFMRAITEPNVAYIFLMLGIYGIFFELSRPGAILPGVVGAIGLLLALLAFQGLPVNYVGVLLIMLGVLMLLLEIKVTSFGALTVGGMVSLVLGSLVLFENAGPLGTLSLKVVLPVVLFSVVLFLGIVGLGLKAQRKPPTTGSAVLIGLEGSVMRIADPDGADNLGGVVEIFGEYWSFDAEVQVGLGDRVVVIACERGRVRVEPLPRDGG